MPTTVPQTISTFVLNSMTDILAVKSRLAALGRYLMQMSSETAAIAASIETQAPPPMGLQSDAASALTAWEKYGEAQRARWKTLPEAQAAIEAGPQIAREMQVRMSVDRYKALTILDSSSARNAAASEIITLSKIP